MKRILFSILMIVALSACKKEVSESPEQKDTTAIAVSDLPTDCTNLDGYLAASSQDAKAEWLRNYGKDVCDSILYKYAEARHRIPDSTKIVRTAGNALKISWKQISDSLGNSVYDKYLSFEKDSKQNITGIKMVPRFTNAYTCYSVPLLRAIAKKHGLIHTSNVKFFNATYNSAPTVIIEIGGATFYDFSDEPTLRGETSPI